MFAKNISDRDIIHEVNIIGIANIICRRQTSLKKPRSFERGFFMAPLVGLEPTTCGLTDHETQSQRAKQSTKNRGRSSVFGDHPATRLIKQSFAKMASSPVAVPILPNSPGRFLPAEIRTGKIQSPNQQGKEEQNTNFALKLPKPHQFWCGLLKGMNNQ